MTKSVQKIKVSSESRAIIVGDAEVSYEIDLKHNCVAIGRCEQGHDLKQLFLTVKEAHALVHSIARHLKRETSIYNLVVEGVTLKYEVDFKNKLIEFQRIEEGEIETISFFENELLALSEIYGSSDQFFANDNRGSKC